MEMGMGFQDRNFRWFLRFYRGLESEWWLISTAQKPIMCMSSAITCLLNCYSTLAKPLGTSFKIMPTGGGWSCPPTGMEMTRYNVGSNIHRGTSSKKVSIWWYVQTSTFVPTPSFSHLADGSSVQGNLSHLVKSAKSGYEIRCVTAKKYAFPLQNVAINSQGVRAKCRLHKHQNEW